MDGRTTLSSTVVLGEGTSQIAIFVDATCFAFAEEGNEWTSAFTLFECREKPATELTGLYVPPARIRISRAGAHMCELPVLLGGTAAAA